MDKDQRVDLAGRYNPQKHWSRRADSNREPPDTRSVHASSVLSGAENTAPTSACCRLAWLSTTGFHGQNHGQAVARGRASAASAWLPKRPSRHQGAADRRRAVLVRAAGRRHWMTASLEKFHGRAVPALRSPDRPRLPGRARRQLRRACRRPSALAVRFAIR